MSDKVDLKDIPQGASSRLDADTVDGLQTSRFKSPAPNTLTPLGPDGKFPTSTIPINPAGFTGSYVDGVNTTITIVNGIITNVV